LVHANEQAAHGQQDQGEAEEQRLDRFMRNHPPTFKGRYDPNGAQTWLQGVDWIFRAIVTSDNQRVRLATHMLAEEAEFWCINAKRKLEVGGIVVCRLRSILLSLRNCLGFVLTSMLKLLRSLSVSSLIAVYAHRSTSMCVSMRFMILTLW
jgi:hypothetical protein